MKTVKLGDLFTEEELHEAEAIGSDHARLRDEIVAPAIERINGVTGQENDADYLAYALEYAIQEAGRR